MLKLNIIAGIFLTFSLTLTVNAQTAQSDQGKTQYENRCGACHSPESNRIGPKHQGIVGRKMGSIADYEYSEALKKSRHRVWTTKLLDQWLTNPEKLIPGQKMNYQLSSPSERQLIIRYLETLK